MRLTLVALATCLILFPFASAAEPSDNTYAVGVAQIDITPSYAVRLSGFGGRRTRGETRLSRSIPAASVFQSAKPNALAIVPGFG